MNEIIIIVVELVLFTFLFSEFILMFRKIFHEKFIIKKHQKSWLEINFLRTKLNEKEDEIVSLTNKINEKNENVVSEQKFYEHQIAIFNAKMKSIDIKQKSIVNEPIIEEDTNIEEQVLDVIVEYNYEDIKDFYKNVHEDILSRLLIKENAIVEYKNYFRQINDAINLKIQMLSRSEKIIFLLYDMYTEDEIHMFKSDFDKYMYYMKDYQISRIVKSKYFSSEKKIELLAKTYIFEELNSEFITFLYYCLKNYDTRYFRKLHRSFSLIYELLYNEKTMFIEMTNSNDTDQIESIAKSIITNIKKIEIIINPDILGGMKIEYDDISLDASLNKLVEEKILNWRKNESNN